jgi:hypothetical protein
VACSSVLNVVTTFIRCMAASTRDRLPDSCYCVKGIITLKTL